LSRPYQSRHLRTTKKTINFKGKAGLLGLVLALFASLLAGGAPAFAEPLANDYSGVTQEVRFDPYVEYGNMVYAGDYDGPGYVPAGIPPISVGVEQGSESADSGITPDNAGYITGPDFEGEYAHSPPTTNAETEYELPDDDAATSPDDEPNEADGGVLLSPASGEASGITVDLRADWDVTAPAQSPPGAQLLAYFVIGANDIEQGSAGSYNFTVILDGVNAGFATYARGTTSNGGRTLTVPFNQFQLATSERFGFSLIGDQQGYMGAIVRVLNPAGVEVARAELTPRPVLPGTEAWDLVVSQHEFSAGSIQDQIVGLRFNLTLDRTSPIPVGDIVFNLGFQDANAESAQVTAATRFHMPSWVNYGQRNVFGVHSGDSWTLGGGQNVPAYVTPVAGGWQFRIPADGINPFADIPRTGGNGAALDAHMRVFASIGFDMQSGPISHLFQNSINFAGQVWDATWGEVSETNRGITTTVAGQPTINNRVAFTFTPAGGFSSVWHPSHEHHAILQTLWGTHTVNAWPQTNSLQNTTAVYSAAWSASDWLPYGSEVSSRAHTTGAGYVANCLAIDPAVTPFQGRVVVVESRSNPQSNQLRLWATRAPIENLQNIDCYNLGGWFEVPRGGTTSASIAYFNLPNPGSITAVRAIGHTNMTTDSMHYTRMSNPTQAGWLTARGWWPRSANIDDIYQPTTNSEHVHAATPDQIFASTNGTRDIIWGNYGFPRVVKSASNTNPEYGETVTFTIRAVNVSNAGTMAMVVYDQMDHRLEFVPGTVRVNGVQAANPSVSGVKAGRFVPGSQVRELVFDLGSRPVNQIQTITFDAIARWDVGQVINSAWMEPTPQAQQYGFTGINTLNGTLSQVALNRQLTGNIVLTKDVARDYMGPNTGVLTGTVSAQNAWLLTVLNGTSGGADSTVIDIFPFYGDERGTTNNVQHQMMGFASDHPVVVYYTTTDPGRLPDGQWGVNPDPAYAGNANPGGGNSIWRRFDTFEAGQERVWRESHQPTALLIITSAPIASGARANYEIPFTARTLRGEQGTFINYAWQRDNANQLRLVRAAVTVSEFPEITVYKTIDGQNIVGVPANSPQVVTFEVVNTGTEALTNITLVDDTLIGPAVENIQFPGFGFNNDGFLYNTATGIVVTLQPGASLTASGLLPGMSQGERHQNEVTVSGVGTRTRDNVTDNDILLVETVEVHISKDILNPINGQNTDGFISLAVDPETGLTSEQEVTFTIINRSSEGLTNLVFEDALLFGHPITGISFDEAIVQSVNVDGAVTQVVFNPDFILGPNASIIGTGILAPMQVGERHHNVASVHGEGVVTGLPAEDGTDNPADPDSTNGPDTPDEPETPKVPDNELIVETVDIEITKTIAGLNLIGVPVNTPQTVDFAFTNTGSEPLTNVTVNDVTLVGPAVENIVFDGWESNVNGYLANPDTGALLVKLPGQTITATGTLPGMEAEERHENLVTVTGIGLRSQMSVADDDLLIVETTGVHIGKDILQPVDGQNIDGIIYLDVDPNTGLTAPQIVSFTITNLSSEGLTNLVFEDRLIYGAPITGIVFDEAITQSITVTGEVVTVVFASGFILEPGAQITGTGVLAPMVVGEWHHNAASVQGVGVVTGTPTEDGSDQPAEPEGGDGPDVPTPPDNELIADTVGIRIEKFIAGAELNDVGNPILQGDRETGVIPSQEITFRVTDIGSEALTNLLLVDVTLELPNPSSIAFPTIAGAVVTPLGAGGIGPDWQVNFGDFVLLPGQVVYGLGILPPLSGEGIKHHNVVTITGEGISSGREVNDVDNLMIDPADLEITKTVRSDDGRYQAGGTVTWTVTVTNHGPDRAVNVDIEDRLDNPSDATITGAKFTQIPTGRQTRISYTTATVDAWLEYLENGETVVIEITGVLSRYLLPGDEVWNSARVLSDTPHPNPGHDEAVAKLPIRLAYSWAVRAAYRPQLHLTGAGPWLLLVGAPLLVGGVAMLVARKRGLS